MISAIFLEDNKSTRTKSAAREHFVHRENETGLPIAVQPRELVLFPFGRVPRFASISFLTARPPLTDRYAAEIREGKCLFASRAHVLASRSTLAALRTPSPSTLRTCTSHPSPIFRSFINPLRDPPRVCAGRSVWPDEFELLPKWLPCENMNFVGAKVERGIRVLVNCFVACFNVIRLFLSRLLWMNNTVFLEIFNIIGIVFSLILLRLILLSF